MANTTAQSLIDKAHVILHDTTSVRWPDTELLGWLNDGVLELVNIKPDAAAQTALVRLTPSDTKQTVSGNIIQILNIIRNNSTKKPMRMVDREILDAQIPNWHSTVSATNDAIHWCYDELNPKVFYVYPAVSGSTVDVLMVYSQAPASITVGQTIPVDDTYAPALLNYILYRAYSKDADYSANKDRMMNAYQSFMSSLGVRMQREKSDDPNIVEPARSPSIRG